MIDAEELRAARNRNDSAACFPEIGIVGRRPEDRRHWNACSFLKRVGDGECAQRLGQRVDRASEQARLLARCDDHSLSRAGPFESLLRFPGSIECRRQTCQPIASRLRSNRVEAFTPGRRIGGDRLVPVRRRTARHRRGGEGIAAERLSYDSRIH